MNDARCHNYPSHESNLNMNKNKNNNNDNHKTRQKGNNNHTTTTTTTNLISCNTIEINLVDTLLWKVEYNTATKNAWNLSLMSHNQ